VVPRGGMPRLSRINQLECQTAARGDFDPQRFSGEVANRHPSAKADASSGPATGRPSPCSRTGASESPVAPTAYGSEPGLECRPEERSSARGARREDQLGGQVGAEAKPQQPALQARRDSMALSRIRVGARHRHGDEAPPLREAAE
jgi:hypothetical protein